VAYGGIRQLKWMKFNMSIPFEERVDKVIEWMTKDQLRLVTLYFEEPDKTGHSFGPDSFEVS
jgi:ectonucleotide pyrophosphatase/phosphodiesterase family member 5